MISTTSAQSITILKIFEMEEITLTALKVSTETIITRKALQIFSIVKVVTINRQCIFQNAYVNQRPALAFQNQGPQYPSAIR